MRPEFITVGTIVNAHGIRGEVKVNPAGFDPEFIADFKTMYIAGQPVKVKAARVHKSTVLLALPGVDTMDDALALKGRAVSIRRTDARLPRANTLTRSWRAAPWWTMPPVRSWASWTECCSIPPTRSIRCGAARTSI